MWTRGRLHKFYEVAVPIVLLLQLGATIVYHSLVGPRIAGVLICG